MKHAMDLYWNNLYIELALEPLAVILTAVVVSLIHGRKQVANTWKFRTLAFIFLAVAIPFIRELTIPLYLLLAYRSYKAGDRTPAHPAGAVHAAGPVMGVLGMILMAFIKEAASGQANNSMKNHYYFDGQGEPYPYPRDNLYIDAADLW